MKKGQWEDFELKFIKQNYKTLTYQEIADKLDRTKTAVDLKINRLGLKKSKYVYNKDFFKEIDTEEKAYWLGFIMADGCVSHIKNNNEESYELSIKLQGRDIEHLKKFNKSIKGNLQIATFNRKMNFNNQYYDGCQIRIYSKQIVMDLIHNGVIPNKTMIMTFPDLQENLIPHFIRGYFDGDGCISNDSNKRKRIQANFTSGSLSFLQSLRIELFRNNINSYFYAENENTYRLYIKGLKNCDVFFEYIYKDSTIYLDRKLKKKKFLYEKYEIAQRLLL